jgi:hypothetical protein
MASCACDAREPGQRMITVDAVGKVRRAHFVEDKAIKRIMPEQRLSRTRFPGSSERVPAARRSRSTSARSNRCRSFGATWLRLRSCWRAKHRRPSATSKKVGLSSPRVEAAAGVAGRRACGLDRPLSELTYRTEASNTTDEPRTADYNCLDVAPTTRHYCCHTDPEANS